MSARLNRRRFLKSTAVAVGVAAGSRAFGAPAFLADAAPNSKLGVAVIGCVNQGLPALNAAAGERFVAMCDVDEAHLGKAVGWLSEKHPKVKGSAIRSFSDYRKMYDEIPKDLDAIFIAAPDHHHAPAALMAMELGKHVYVEKPLAHSVDECRRLAAAAKRYKVMTQLGNQGHSGEGIRRLCEYIWAGAIGNVVETYSWAPTGRGGRGGRLPAKPVPKGLDWDAWIGPCEFRDYHDELHPKLWRSWWEFGDGSIGDWGCHNLDGVFWALKLGHPTSIEVLAAEGGSQERFPILNTIRWNFPARGDMPAVKVHWYDGYRGGAGMEDDDESKAKAQNRPPIVAELEKKYGRDLKNGGAVYVGDKGIMISGNYAGSPRIVPEEKHRAFPMPPKKLPRLGKGLTHQTDFLRACRDGKPCSSDFSYGGALSEVVLLGCLAVRAGVGKKVEWDGEKMQCTNLPELNRMVKREYRAGWGM
jgi:predicted dehydrogenase